VTVRGLFVTGTDTGVGKTLIACALVRALATSGLRVAVMKPVASGAARTPQGLRNADALALAACANVPLEYGEVNPFCYEPAVSPHIAAEDAGIPIDVDKITHVYRGLAARAEWVVVEGAGGWLAPLGERASMADLARALGLPVLLVVGLKLGCLNQAQLTHRAIVADGAAFAGWVASGVDAAMERTAQNLATLALRLGEPALAVVPYRAQVSAPLTLEACAARLVQRRLSV
jgi:dethiobiotin synthetase